MMGNVQTPLLQFPHVYYFTSAMFDAGYRNRSEKEVLLDLCGHLYPEHKQLLADCYLALKESDPAKIQSLADRLDRLIREDKLGRLGIFGRKLFPDHRIVAQSLRPATELPRGRPKARARSDADPLSKADCEKLLCDYFDAYLAWDTAHGWHNLWGWNQWQVGTPPAVAEKLAKSLGDRSAVDACLRPRRQTLSAKYDKTAVEVGCIDPVEERRACGRSDDRQSRAEGQGHGLGHSESDAISRRATPTTAGWPPCTGPARWSQNNTEWLQLTWDKPQTFDKVIVRFLQHPSMHGRTIHLQKEVAPGKWEDFATTTIPADGAAPHAVATFKLPNRVTLDKIRIVNLLDVFEVEVY